MRSYVSPLPPARTRYEGGPYFPCADTYEYKAENGTMLTFTAEEIEGEEGPEPREWGRSDMNFDNVLEGMIVLFISASGEGWPDIMWECCDVTEVDFSWKRDNSAGMAYVHEMSQSCGGKPCKARWDRNCSRFSVHGLSMFSR